MLRSFAITAPNMQDNAAELWYLGASLQFAAAKGGDNGTVYLDDIKLVTTPRLIEGKEPVALTTTTTVSTTTTVTTTTSVAGGSTASPTEAPVASAGGGGGATQTVLIIIIVILVVALVGLAVKHYQLRQSTNGGYDVSDASVSSSSTTDVRNSALAAASPSSAAASSYDNPIYGEGDGRDRYGSVGRGR